MAKQSRSKKAPRKARAAKTSPVKSPRKAAGKSAKAPKAARKAKAAPKAREPQKAAPRAAKATRKPKAPKAPRARKVRPPKPVEVYGHDAPYNCDDPFVKEPVRLRVCRPDPRKPSRRKCDVREFVVEGCATPGPGRRAKQMYVVPHTHRYLAPAREVARARVMPLPDNGDCADARFAHAHGRSIAEGAYGACNISESSEAGLTIDPASISFPNGYGRARGQMARGSRHNPPLLVPGRNYRWASPHGGSGVVTYLSGDGRTARVSLNGSVFGVPTRELLPMGADIGVGYPMTFPNGADAVGMGTSPTFLPPPKSDPHIGKRVFGKNVQGMVRGVARCGEKGPRQYVVGGQIVSRARVASSLKREKLMAEGNWPPPRRARSAPQVVPAPMPRRERAPEVMGPAWSPPPPRIMLPPPERIIEAQVVETRPARSPSAPRGKAKQTTMALDAPLLARAPAPQPLAMPAARSPAPDALSPHFADDMNAEFFIVSQRATGATQKSLSQKAVASFVDELERRLIALPQVQWRKVDAQGSSGDAYFVMPNMPGGPWQVSALSRAGIILTVSDGSGKKLKGRISERDISTSDASALARRVADLIVANDRALRVVL